MNDTELEVLLLATFFRRDCPSTMELGDIQMGILSGEEEENVREHLGRCQYCKEEMGRLGR